MKLRTYLVKRTIHMIITILIVLVLLFVLYRMMPGSAAAQMMMNPKMTQNEINQVLVRYGFGRWADYPGDYAVTNYNAQTIGRFSVTVEAVGDDGQIDSFTTQFDINAPEDSDYIAPKILDIGLSSLPAIGQEAEFYVLAYDESALRSTEVMLTCPNLVVVDGTPVPYNETIKLSPVSNMTDEANSTFYLSGRTSAVLVAGIGGDSNFTAEFWIQDNPRNMASAALTFDAGTGQVTSKVWNLSADVPFLNGIYTYPNVGQAITIDSNVIGAATPSFSLVTPDLSDAPAVVALTGPDAVGRYSGPHTAVQNGILMLKAEVGDISATYRFAVNSVSTMPGIVQDDDATYPLLSDLTILSMDRSGRDIVSPEYPFINKDLRLKVNATALNEDGSRCANISAYVMRPDGVIQQLPMYHPTYVKMRTTAEQFVIYMKTMLVFDFGMSYMYQRPSWDIILERVPSTALLFGTALVVAYALGIMIGVVVAWRRGTVLEMGTIIVTLFFYSMPIFWFALIMQWVFYAQLGWFPIAGMGGIYADGAPMHGLTWFIDILWHLAMPLTTLVILGLAGDILLMRSAMLEVIGEDFTVTAKAKGLKERTVIFKHVARNAMLPVVTAMAMSIGSIISGGVLTETIFSWYGMGTLLIEGTLTKDFPVVQGAFYILALLTILGNMAADILYAWLDPRVQL